MFNIFLINHSFSCKTPSDNRRSSANEKCSSLRSNQNADYSLGRNPLWCIRKYENFFFVSKRQEKTSPTRLEVENSSSGWLLNVFFLEKSFEPKKAFRTMENVYKAKSLSRERWLLSIRYHPVFGIWSCVFHKFYLAKKLFKIKTKIPFVFEHFSS